MNMLLFQNPYFLGLGSFVLGIIATVITTRILNKQAVLGYFVNHMPVAQSTADSIFGTIEVKWNGTAVSNLFLSSIDLTNSSVRDFENIEIRAHSSDTRLLSEKTEILGSTRTIGFPSEYLAKLQPDESGNLTQAQWDILATQRDYIIPVFNRNQTIRITFLNSAISGNSPTIWLDVLHKGVKVKFREPRQQFLGVDQPQAALVGSVVGFAMTWALFLLVPSMWVVVLCSFMIGISILFPGVFVIKAWRKFRGFLVD